MRFHSQLERVKQRFAYDEVFQLFLKHCAGELTSSEQQRIKTWITSEPDRDAIYHSINRTIEHLKRLETDNHQQVREVLRCVKEEFPKEFGDLPERVSFFLLPGIVKANLELIQWNLCRKIVYAGRWTRVVAASVRLATVLLMIFILIWIFNYKRAHHKQLTRPVITEVKNERNAKAVNYSITVLFGRQYRGNGSGVI